jgi:hypothetical protein
MLKFSGRRRLPANTMLQRHAALERLSCGAPSQPMASSAAAQNKPFFTQKARENSLKLKERSGNVYENKGPLRNTRERSGNVVENKVTYRHNPGMLLKTKELVSANGRCYRGLWVALRLPSRRLICRQRRARLPGSVAAATQGPRALAPLTGGGRPVGARRRLAPTSSLPARMAALEADRCALTLAHLKDILIFRGRSTHA